MIFMTIGFKNLHQQKVMNPKKRATLFSGRQDRVYIVYSDVESPMVHVIIKKITSKKAFCPSEARLIQSMPSSQNYSPSLSLNNPPNKALLLGGGVLLGGAIFNSDESLPNLASHHNKKLSPPFKQGSLYYQLKQCIAFVGNPSKLP